MQEDTELPIKIRLATYVDTEIAAYITADADFHRTTVSDYMRSVFLKMMRNDIRLDNFPTK